MADFQQVDMTENLPSGLELFLLSALWGTVFLLLARFCLLFMNRRSASLRHLVWALSFSGLISLPFFHFVVPKQFSLSEVGRTRLAFDTPDSSIEILDEHLRENMNLHLGAAEVQSETILTDDESNDTRERFAESGLAATNKGLEDSPRLLMSTPTLQSVSKLAVAAWQIIFAILVLGHLLASLRRVFGKYNLVPRDSRIAPIIASVLTAKGRYRRVQVILDCHNGPPSTWGIVRPKIALPVRSMAWSSERTKAVLLHEIGHVSRGDFFVHTVACLATYLHWFNPLAWLSLRAMGREREVACDDFALRSGLKPTSYAEHLLHVAHEFVGGGRMNSASLAIARGRSDIERRIRFILDCKRNRTTPPLRVHLCGTFSCVTILVLAGTLGFAQLDTTEAAGQDTTVDSLPNSDAANLVEAVYDSFDWIDRANTIRISNRYRTRPTKEHVEHEAAHPTRTPFGDNGKANPNPFVVDTTWIWTADRIRYYTESYHEQSEGPKYIGTRNWDGTLAVECSATEEQGHTQYVLDNKVESFFGTLVENNAMLPWGPGGVHDFWWNHLEVSVAEHRQQRGVAPSDFEIEGEVTLRGKPCHVLVSKAGHYRWFVGVEDGRLYRRSWYTASNKDPNYDRLKLCQQIGGPRIKSLHHWNGWLDSLSADEGRRIRRELQIATFPFLKLKFHQDFDNYQEVAPDCWIPFTIRHESFRVWDVAKPFLERVSMQVVQSIAVDEHIPESEFQFELLDGVRVVTDWRYEPWIQYAYDKAQTEKERLVLAEEKAKEQQEITAEMEKRRATLESRLGSLPPSLPNDGWVNGEPLTWKHLKGKVVVLHFWDKNCPPCDNEIPFLTGWHEGGDSSIAIIGIHSATDDIAAVREKMKRLNVTYPVLVDTNKEEAGLGELHEWFGNTWWPNTVLIDKKGQVAGHGTVWLGTISKQIRQLVSSE